MILEVLGVLSHPLGVLSHLLEVLGVLSHPHKQIIWHTVLRIDVELS
jgi:hypothetical protein